MRVVLGAVETRIPPGLDDLFEKLKCPDGQGGGYEGTHLSHPYILSVIFPIPSAHNATIFSQATGTA
jgi:hypothetical protein